MKIFLVNPNVHGDVVSSIEELKQVNREAYERFLPVIKPENCPLVLASIERCHQAAEQAMANPFTVVEYEARGTGRAYVFAVPDAALQPVLDDGSN